MSAFFDASIYAVFISSASPSPFLHDWGVPDAVPVSRPPSYSENCIYQVPWQVHHSDLPFPLLQPSYDDSAAWLHFRCRTHRCKAVPLGEAFRRPMDAIGELLTLSACAWNVRPFRHHPWYAFFIAFQPMPMSRKPAPFDDPEWVFELKYYGFRWLAVIQGGRCELTPQPSPIQLSRYFKGCVTWIWRAS